MKPKFEIGDTVRINENILCAGDIEPDISENLVGVIGEIISVTSCDYGKAVYEIHYSGNYSCLNSDPDMPYDFYETELSECAPEHPIKENYSEITVKSFIDALI